MILGRYLSTNYRVAKHATQNEEKTNENTSMHDIRTLVMAEAMTSESAASRLKSQT